MRVSIVTIAFNQGQFLTEAIESVLSQNYTDLEYIVVDPGSTDDTQNILNKYKGRLILISEPDKGPADGLNKGFARATGEIFAYLNADDVLLPGAVHEAAKFFKSLPNIDVLCGHTWIVDTTGKKLRRSHSDGVNLTRIAYGAAVQMQPSTFIRAEAFRRAGGFNIENRSNWDGELVVDMALSGARFKVVNRYWSQYRLHDNSITGTKKLDDIIRKYRSRLFNKIMGRDRNEMDNILKYFHLTSKYLTNPKALTERLLRGPVYGRPPLKE